MTRAVDGGRAKGPWSFDPEVVGRTECEVWVGYYRREWTRVLRSYLRLVRTGFDVSWRDSVVAAWWVMRANQAWAPLTGNDPERARAAMERFYRLVARAHDARWDPRRAAELEVEWWRVHREHQRGLLGEGPEGDGADEDRLTTALAVLYGYVYEVPPEAVREAARLRADAMDVSDAWVAAGCDPDDPRLDVERDLLVRSYVALRAVVRRPAA